jgi:hypothetical protein
MKGWTELAIGFVLLALMYEKPYVLTEFSNSILGKALLIIGVGLIAKNKGLVSGLLSALVVLILMHETTEGFKGEENKKPAKIRIIPDAVSAKKLSTLTTSQECGVAKTEYEGGKCVVYIYPEVDATQPVAGTKVDKKKGSSKTKEGFASIGVAFDAAPVTRTDVRMIDGRRRRAAYENTISAMKQSNGHTCNKNST